VGVPDGAALLRFRLSPAIVGPASNARPHWGGGTPPGLFSRYEFHENRVSAPKRACGFRLAGLD
jgi:hypothetical protein